jgi:hypothetical protein
MKININGRDITLKYSFRSMMIYEKITGETFNPKGLSEILIYFYSTVLASDKECNITFDDFIDYTDEHPELFNEFSKWLTDTISKNAYINGNTDEQTEVEPKKV